MTEEAVAGVLEDLRWLGLDHDEGPDVGGPHEPYRQSQRLEIYRVHAERLLAQGDAYRCYCTPDELEGRRAEALARNEAPGYDGHCRDLSAGQVGAFEAEDASPSCGSACPDREWVIDDVVKGVVRFAPGSCETSCGRSDASPVFLLAVAVDDLLMEVTHVVRGDDLLASAPRNAAVIEALGGTPLATPTCPKCSVPTGSRSRSGTARRASSPSGNRVPGRGDGELPRAARLVARRRPRVLSRDELVEAFELERVSSNPAAFDTEKLIWLNNRYIQSLDDDDLAARCLHFLTEDGLMPDPSTLRAAMPIVKERMKTLTEAPALLRFLFTDDLEPNEKAAGLIAKAPDGYLGRVADAFEAVEPWETGELTAALDALARNEGLSRTRRSSRCARR